MNRAEAAVVLGVSVTATRAEVDEAFRRAARRSHPDAGGDAVRFTSALDARRALRRSRPATAAPPTSSGVPTAPVHVVSRSELRRRQMDRTRRRILRRLGVHVEARVR